jgi:predicted permease
MVAQSLRYGWRAVRHTPGSALIVILTLGLVVGAAMAAFAVINATVLSPLPLREPDRVFFLEHGYGEGGGSVSPPLLRDHRRALTSFESLSAAMPFNANLTGSGEVERLQGLLVSGDFFSTFGVDALHGRVLRMDEEQPGNDRVVVLSHGLWHRRFGGRLDVIGTALQLNGESYEVVGIMPPTFTWGRVYGRQGVAELWAPFALTPARIAENQRGSEFLDVYGRLKPSATIPQVQAEIDKEISDLRGRFPNRYTVASGFYIKPVPIREELIGEMRATLLAVFVAVLSLALVAAINVAGLLIARAGGRQRDMSVHAALGAGRARLIANNFGEAAVLAAGSGALAFALAWLGATLLDGVNQVTLPRARAIHLDAVVVMFGLTLTALVGLLAGALPSWHAWRDDLSSALRISPQNSAAHSSLAGRALIVAQTAVTLALLAAAGLLVQSLSRLDRIDAGVREDVLTAQIQLPRLRYADAAARLPFVDQVLASFAGRPDVAAAVVSELPLSGVGNSGTFDIDGKIVPESEKQPHAEMWSATPGYFATIGIPLRQGRLFDDRDVAGRPLTVLINDALAQMYFPGEDPIGKRIDYEGNATNRRWREIVGVVGDVRDRGLDKAPEPQLYMPYAQRATAGMFLVMRHAGAPLAMVPELRNVIRNVDPTLPIYNVNTIAALRDANTRNRRIAGTALTVFSSTAVFVACLGLYGLIAQSVRHRRREIGVRVAVGAAPSLVMKLFLREGLMLIAAGVLLGIAIAIPATRLMRTIVFDVSTTDPWTYAGVALLLLAVGVLTSAIPAWRAARIDPVTALRT